MKSHIIGLLLLATPIGALIGAAEINEQRQRIQKKAPPVVIAAGPESTAKLGGVRHKLLLAVVRHRTIAKLQSEGVKGKKYSKDEAAAAWDNLQKNHPELIDGAIAEGSPQAVAQVGAGGRLADFLQWLSDHKDEILQIVELIVKILSLFG